MKLKIYTLLLALSVTWSLQSCDNDDDGSIAVPAELQSAFSSKFPNAANVKWETKSGYYVADFYDGYEASAWFTQDGKWQMTETDIPYNALPQAVKMSFENSEYASWKRDDIDKLERTGVETVFVIEVEKQNQEVDLYYSADGTLIKSIVDTDDDNSEHLPVQYTEVDIIHNGIPKDVLFNQTGNWYSTSWEIRQNELPEAVNNTLNNQYGEYRFDEAEYIEKADGSIYYRIELEKGDVDKVVNIGENGTVLS